MRLGARLVLAGGAALAALAIGLAVARNRDDGDDGRRVTLLDGSPARRVPAELRLGEDAALARVRVLQPAERGRDAQACFRLAGLAEPGNTPVLELIGVDGRSLTFLVDRRRGIAACEASALTHEPRAGPWCGVAQGRLHGGRLRDGRLGMVNCLDRDRHTVAFGWIEPAPGAAWLAVRGEGATEVYPVVPGFPLRITTKHVRLDRSSALFDVAQYAADGRRITAGQVEMTVAG